MLQITFKKMLNSVEYWQNRSVVKLRHYKYTNKNIFQYEDSLCRIFLADQHDNTFLEDTVFIIKTTYY